MCVFAEFLVKKAMFTMDKVCLPIKPGCINRKRWGPLVNYPIGSKEVVEVSFRGSAVPSHEVFGSMRYKEP